MKALAARDNISAVRPNQGNFNKAVLRNVLEGDYTISDAFKKRIHSAIYSDDPEDVKAVVDELKSDTLTNNVWNEEVDNLSEELRSAKKSAGEGATIPGFTSDETKIVNDVYTADQGESAKQVDSVYDQIKKGLKVGFTTKPVFHAFMSPDDRVNYEIMYGDAIGDPLNELSDKREALQRKLKGMQEGTPVYEDTKQKLERHY